jgi:hypothetical protein
MSKTFGIVGGNRPDKWQSGAEDNRRNVHSLADFHHLSQPSDAAVEQFIDRVGVGRLIWHINNRRHAIRLSAAK